MNNQVKSPDEALKIINEYWNTLKHKPTLSEINRTMHCEPAIVALEVQYPELIYQKADKESKYIGTTDVPVISMLSLVASITALLTGRTLCVVIDPTTQVVIKWGWLYAEQENQAEPQAATSN